MKKRLFSIFLSSALVLSMMPAGLMAVQGESASTSGAMAYDLWVGGVQVLSTNKDDITAAINADQPGAASGTAVYTPASEDAPAKLELTDFHFNGTGYHKAWSDDYRTYDAYYGIYTTSDLEIVMTGYNVVEESSEEPGTIRVVRRHSILPPAAA